MVRASFYSVATIVAGALFFLSPAQAQTRVAETRSPVGTSGPAHSVTRDQAIDLIVAREREEVALLGRFHPIIETYLQELRLNKNKRAVLWRDYYFIGQADLAHVSARPMLPDSVRPQMDRGGWHAESFEPRGFIQMVYIDRFNFDRQHYQFTYAGRDFLGEVRCLLFDVAPLPKSGKGRFEGRIWVEDQNYTIVRFNGVYVPIHHDHQYYAHFDSWRLNLQPGLWLPALAFTQEKDLLYGGDPIFKGHLRFRAQTRFWGYHLASVGRGGEFSKLLIDTADAVQDDNDGQEEDRPPVLAQREWRREAETNVLDALQATGLLAPPGEVDKVLDTVVNNLEVTNNLDSQPQVHCRVLTTSNFEMFTVGHTVIVSRGLLDVLPDEATLAAILAEGLADVAASNSSIDAYGFNDRVQVSPLDALKRFSFRKNRRELETNNQRALSLLQNSPYKDKLASAGLFLRQLHDQSKSLSALVDPHLGSRIYLASQLISSAPPIQPSNLQQIAALPIGGRIKLDPWSNEVELLKAKPVALVSEQEKMPFEITPLMPFLVRYGKTRGESKSAALDGTEAVPARADE